MSGRSPATVLRSTLRFVRQFHWCFAPLLLFILKMAADVSGDRGGKTSTAKSSPRIHIGGSKSVQPACLGPNLQLQVAQQEHVVRGPDHAAMRGLWELESDPELKAAYANELGQRGGRAEQLRIAQQFDNDDSENLCSTGVNSTSGGVNRLPQKRPIHWATNTFS